MPDVSGVFLFFFFLIILDVVIEAWQVSSENEKVYKHLYVFSNLFGKHGFLRLLY